MPLPTDKLQSQVQRHPYPLLFATISGAHLYGFPSADSDFDLRGVHLLPLSNVLSLDQHDETVSKSGIDDGLEIDLVTHDAKKFFKLLLRKNGYVLEQVFSPLVIHTTPEFDELKSIVPGCITRNHAYHYNGFAHSQWKLFKNADTQFVKPLLYTYRVLMTGIHLMQTGRIEANVSVLNSQFSVPLVDDLVKLKANGKEKEPLPPGDFDRHEKQVQGLFERLDAAASKSTLPETPSARSELNDLLIRLRTQ